MSKIIAWPRVQCTDERDRSAAPPHQAAERGQTLVIVAVLLVVLIGFLALVLDLGNALAQRRRMQNAADAAALAGVRGLALGQPSASIQSAINEYAVQRNGAQGCQAKILTSTITVVVSRTFPTFFASVAGIPTFTVRAAAQAGYGFPSSWKGDLLPLCVQKDWVTTTHDIQIWDDDKEFSDSNLGKIADGQRGWLNFNGGEVSDTELEDWVAHGYREKVNVDGWINGTPGTKTAALQVLLETRLNTDIVIPVYDYTRSPGIMGNGSLDYHVVGFAMYHLTDVVYTGNPKFTKGRFIRYVAPQEAGGTTNTGVVVISLKQ